MKQLNELKRMQQLAGLITESQLNENNFFGFSYKNKNKDVDTKKLMAMDEKEAFQIARKWMEKNNLDPNEIQSMKQLDQYEIEKYDEITEVEIPQAEIPQAESIEQAVNEALNKDIKVFGQDLDKRFKEAGFDTLVIMKSPSPEQLNIIKTKENVALFEVSETPGAQMLTLRVNPKMAAKAESIVNKFQLSDYNGPVLKRGWTAKQVQGAINPGDIVKQEDKIRGMWNFYRLAKVDTKVKDITAESIDSVVNEALKAYRKQK
jgi:hypothetical protein